MHSRIPFDQQVHVELNSGFDNILPDVSIYLV
jgi:hypothetical protein